MAVPQQDKPAGTNLRAKPRRFRLSDGMILIVAAALGFAATTAVFATDEWSWSAVKDQWNDGDPARTIFALGLGATPTLVTLMLSLIPIRMLRPRPRRWASQPGFVAALACLTVVGILGIRAIGILMQVMDWKKLLQFDLDELLDELHVFPLTYVPIAIASAWLTLVVGRRWRPERSWIDRTGRVLGSLLILWGIASHPLYLYAEIHEPVGFRARTVNSAPAPPKPPNQAPRPITNTVPPG